MFAGKFINSFKKACLTEKKVRRVRARRADIVTEQVKDVLQNSDQQLILMVRS